MIRRVLFAAALAGLVAGCNGSNSVPPPVVPTATPTPTPSPTPVVAPQHLYVGNDGATGQIVQYTLPVTAASAANFGFTSANVVSMGVDATGNLVAGDNAGHLTFFAAPLSAASVATATFANGSGTNDGQIAVTAAGDIFVGSVGANVNVFTHPFTNASTPSLQIVTPGTSIVGVAFDAAGNLYASNAGVTSNLYVYAPPYTGVPITTPGLATTAYRKIALNATQLFATSVAGATGRVDVYTLPITAASAPAFTITSGVNTPEGIAFDAAGNLYVGNLSNATVTVYAPPFSAASAPTVSLVVSAGSFALFGLTIGK